MARVEKSIVISAPRESVFAYIEDFPRWPEWLPGMVEVTDVQRTKEVAGSHFRWVYKMAGLQFWGAGMVAEHVPNQRLVVQSTGGIQSLWTWSFEDVTEATKVTIAAEYTVPMFLQGKAAGGLVVWQKEREAELALVNIKTRLEG